MRGTLFRVLLCLALAAATGAARAQAGGGVTGNPAVTDVRPLNFPMLFPFPTHNNGYEEWVQAGDLIQGNQAIDFATDPGTTLTFKRRMLSDPNVVQALALLHEGLKKPIRSPHEMIDENTRFVEMALFRKLARLLSTVEYVEFADGRVDAAIDTLRDGLAFGYYIQTNTLISGLVGVAVDAIVLKGFAGHIEQLSVYQCDRVQRLVEEFLKAENPALHLLACEKGQSMKMLEARRSDANALLALLDTNVNSDDAQEAADFGRLQEHLTTHPGDLNSLLNATEARISAAYDQALLNLSLPLVQQKPFVPDKSSAPDALFARMFLPNLQAVADKYSADQAKLRQLGVHALIRRYRWEHNALPASLAELHADDLIKDPFTGDQILYQRQGDSYTLFSAGPLVRDESAPAGATERTPVQLIPK